MTELLPCPFCGATANLNVIDDEAPDPIICAWVHCSCGVESRERLTVEEAVSHWNRRAPVPIKKRVRHSLKIEHYEGIASGGPFDGCLIDSESTIAPDDAGGHYHFVGAGRWSWVPCQIHKSVTTLTGMLDKKDAP